MLKIKYKAPLLIISTVIITAAIVVCTNRYTTQRLIEHTKTSQLKTVSTLILNDLIDQGNSAASKVALIIDRPDVQQAFRENNRDKLKELMLPTFTTLKNKFNVRDAQFNLPPATVFLRVHNPSLYGDDNSSFREMILLAEKNKKEYRGIEIGRSGVSIRAIDIVKDEKGPIGTFEIGMSFGTILENIKRNTGFDAAIFVDDALITRVATSRQRPGPERILGDLQGIGATDWTKILPYVNADLLNKVKDVTYLTQDINGTDYGIVLIPLLDFKSTEIGVIVAITNYAAYQQALKYSFLTSLALALFQIILISGAVLITFQTLLYKPIEYLTNTVASWNKGDQNASLNVLTRRSDEMGILAKEVQELKKHHLSPNKTPPL